MCIYSLNSVGDPWVCLDSILTTTRHGGSVGKDRCIRKVGDSLNEVEIENKTSDT